MLYLTNEELTKKKNDGYVTLEIRKDKRGGDFSYTFIREDGKMEVIPIDRGFHRIESEEDPSKMVIIKL